MDRPSKSESHKNKRRSFDFPSALLRSGAGSLRMAAFAVFLSLGPDQETL